MAMFITLTIAHNGNPVLINVDHVSAFYQADPQKHSSPTRVEIVGDENNVFKVTENLNEITARIDEAASRQIKGKVEPLEKVLRSSLLEALAPLRG